MSQLNLIQLNCSLIYSWCLQMFSSVNSCGFLGSIPLKELFRQFFVLKATPCRELSYYISYNYEGITVRFLTSKTALIMELIHTSHN